MKENNNPNNRGLQGSGPAHTQAIHQPVPPTATTAVCKREREQPNREWYRVRVSKQLIKELGHTALCLANIVALKANLHDGPHPLGLALGEASLDSMEEWGMTRNEFRGARSRLEGRGYATFRKTERGWVGKLTDGRLCRIFPDSHYNDEVSTTDC